MNNLFTEISGAGKVQYFQSRKVSFFLFVYKRTMPNYTNRVFQECELPKSAVPHMPKNSPEFFNGYLQLFNTV